MKIIALLALIFLSACTSLEKVDNSNSVEFDRVNNKIQISLSDKIINKVSKVKTLYDLALIARGLI